jgi:hypothetical protein
MNKQEVTPAEPKPEVNKVDNLSSNLARLINRLHALGNDAPEDVVEGLDKLIDATLTTIDARERDLKAAAEEKEKALKQAAKDKLEAQEKKEAEDKARNALAEKLTKMFNALVTSELTCLEDANICECEKRSLAEKLAIDRINSTVLKNNQYILCKYVDSTQHNILYPEKAIIPAEITGDGVMIVMRSKLPEYINEAFNGAKLIQLAEKDHTDFSIQDCINIAIFTGAPDNIKTFQQLLDHLIRLGAFHICTCKQSKKSKPSKIKKEEIFKAYKCLADRMTKIECTELEVEETK